MTRRLHALFLEHGRYLRNWSPTTLRTYAQALRSLDLEQPTRPELDDWIIRLRAHGLTPGGVNVYVRTVNSYLTWLLDEGHSPARLRVKLLKAPLRQPTLLTATDVRVLVTYRPRAAERQTWTIVLTLLDTGVRITEALTLERARVNLDTLTFTVFGKGAKERTVPFSSVLRRVLYRQLQTRTLSLYVFATPHGGRLSARNVRRSIRQLGQRLHLSCSLYAHLCRHMFAATYIRQGGDAYRLSRFLGHTSMTTTQLYLRSLGVEDLRTGRERLTPLLWEAADAPSVRGEQWR